MSIRLLLAAALVALVGCGGSSSRAEVRLLAPAWAVNDPGEFERTTGCRVDLRVYDEDEDLGAIAERRDVDVVASPTPPGGSADRTVEFVQVTLKGGIEVTVPASLASAFDGSTRPAGSRSIRWTIRDEGDNSECAERWVEYAAGRRG
jgi:hypothetical protein